MGTRNLVHLRLSAQSAVLGVDDVIGAGAGAPYDATKAQPTGIELPAGALGERTRIKDAYKCALSFMEFPVTFPRWTPRSCRLPWTSVHLLT